MHLADLDLAEADIKKALDKLQKASTTDLFNDVSAYTSAKLTDLSLTN